MSLYQYVSNLMPSTEAKSVKVNLETALETITNNLLTGTDMLSTTLKHDYKWKDSDVKEAMASIVKELRGAPALKLPRDAGGVEVIDAILKNMQTTIPYVLSEISRTFDTSIFKSGLTFTKATIMQYAESVDYVTSYTASFLNWVTAVEYNTLDGRDRKSGVSPNVGEWLMANSINYLIAMRIMAMSADELKRGLKSLPQMRIAETPEGEAEQIALGGGNANPFGFASLPWPLSMWYHYRLRNVESQAQEYERLQAQERAIHYRVLLIRQRIQNGQGDASLEKELKIHEERIKNLDYEIKQLAKKYKLEEGL